MQHFIVVYQYGKVASTSLVATLNALPDVEAVQAHFLGRDSLRDMVSLIIDPAASDYFHRHQLGQFVENARTTRVLNAYRQGRGGGSALAIISLYRDPFEWFRSSIVQDITGYLPALKAMRVAVEGTEDEETYIRQALKKILCDFSEIIAEYGGIDAVLERLKARSKVLAAHPLLAGHAQLLPMFYMMLRPFSWFETHFQRAIGYSLDDLAEIDSGVLYRKAAWASLFVLRYESLECQIPVLADRLGVGPLRAMASENVSASKHMAGAVREAFASRAAQVLKAQFAATEYARRFGYEEPMDWLDSTVRG